MLFRAVAAEALSGDFEFVSSVTERHKSEDPEYDSNSFCTDIFDSADVDGLAVVSEPVAKVDLWIVSMRRLIALEMCRLPSSHLVC